MPYHPDVPAEMAGRIYKKQHREMSSRYRFDFGSHERTQTSEGTDEQKARRNPTSGNCQSVSTASHRKEAETTTEKGETDHGQNDYTAESHASESSPCAGTKTTRDGTEAWNQCSLPWAVSIHPGWTYIAPATFRLDLSFEIPGYSDSENHYMVALSEETVGTYRVGVPDGFSTGDAPRSVYELRWEEIWFPTDWEAWLARKTAHDSWAAADPETRGDEPEAAGPEPAKPSLLASREWIWSGADGERSEWFDLSRPPDAGAGEARVVNMLVTCYRCAATGVKPTAHGEFYEMKAT
jgi:hypothetical protein